MSKTVVPVVMSDDGTQHEPMAQGDVMPVSAVPVSTSKLNLLETDSTGLLLTGSGVVSELEHNAIITNTDGKLYLRLGKMLSPEDQVLKVSDNLMRADLSLEFDSATNTLSLLGKDKAVISEHVLPIISGVPTEMEVLRDYLPPKPAGFVENPYKKSTYLHIRYQAAGDKQVDAYVDLGKLLVTAGNGISVKDNVVSVEVAPGGGLTFNKGGCQSSDCTCSCPTPQLLVDMPIMAESLVDPKDRVVVAEEGLIKTVLKLEYDAEKKVISLLGKNDVPIGEAALKFPDIPGLPTQADFVDNPIGYAPGKYLYLQFKLDTGQVKDLYMDVSELVDEYFGGKGIEIDAIKQVSIKADDTLRFVDGKVGVDPVGIIHADDAILTPKDGKLSTTLHTEFKDGNIYFTGRNGSPIAEVKIPWEDMNLRPTGFEWLLNFTPQEGGETGTYLRIHMNGPNGGEDYYINVNPIIAKYGKGLLPSDGTVNIIVDAQGALSFNASNELVLQLRNGLGVDSNKLGIIVDDTSPFTFNSAGEIELAVENGLSIAANRLGVSVPPGSALGFTANKELDINVTQGLVVTGNKLGVAVASDSPFTFNANGEMQLTTGGGFSVVNNNLNMLVSTDGALKFNSNKELMLDTELGLSVKGNKLNVSVDSESPFAFNSNNEMKLRADNGLAVQDNKLRVALPIENSALKVNAKGELELEIASIISPASGNMLRTTDRDGKLYVQNPGLSSSSLGAGLLVNPESGDLTINASDIVDVSTGLQVDSNGKIGVDLDRLASLISSKITAPVSTDSGNVLKTGVDGKPYMAADLGSL